MKCLTPGRLLVSLLTSGEITLLAQVIKLRNPHQLCLTTSRTSTRMSSSVTNVLEMFPLFVPLSQLIL